MNHYNIKYAINYIDGYLDAKKEYTVGVYAKAIQSYAYKCYQEQGIDSKESEFYNNFILVDFLKLYIDDDNRMNIELNLGEFYEIFTNLFYSYQYKISKL